jgi:glycosyltransferase involved in cell wall biosynthesis
MLDRRPKVSIGMPVYNGERFLEQALDSLLSQSFEDFELLIADNASTDGTQDICRSYAAKDARVRYVRNRENYGVIANFNNVFRLTGGRYFKWAAYDDVCAPEFLARCVEILDSDPTVVLACSRIKGIDEDGHRVGYESLPGPGLERAIDKHLDMDASISSAAMDPTKRWRWMMENLWWTPQLYGVIRADVLAKTKLHPAHFMGDHILLAELALHGRFYEVPEDLLFVRVHAQKTSRVAGPRQRLAVVRPDAVRGNWLLPLRLVLVYPERFIAHAASVRRAPLTTPQRLICYWELLAAVLRWAKAKGSRLIRPE